MSESSPVEPGKQQPDVDAMSTVRWSMRVVRQARDRAEKRVDNLVRELAAVKHKVTDATGREQRSRSTFEELEGENTRISSEMTRLKKENGQMRLRTRDLSARYETLMTKLDKTRSDAERRRQSIEDTMSQRSRHLESELQTAIENIDDLNSQLAVERGIHEDLQFNLDTLRKSHGELKELVSELLESGQHTVSEIEEALITSPNT